MSEKPGISPDSGAGSGTTPPGASGSAEKNASPKRKPKSTESSSFRGRPKKDSSSDLKFEAIRVLTNLPEGGKFFLTYEVSDGAKAIDCWN